MAALEEDKMAMAYTAKCQKKKEEAYQLASVATSAYDQATNPVYQRDPSMAPPCIICMCTVFPSFSRMREKVFFVT